MIADDLSTNYLYTLRWEDDSYSVDLAIRFGAASWRGLHGRGSAPT